MISWKKKCLICIIIFVFSIILYKLIQNQYQNLAIQKKIRANKDGFQPNIQEGLDANVPNEIRHFKLNDDGPGVITVKYAQFPDLLLKDYAVKTSYNTAYTGSSMSMSAISYVLTRGYRFLDYEVYMVDDMPVVAYGEDKTSNLITSSNTLPLGQVLYNTISSAFSAPSPNLNDPLFIQLRIYSKDTAIYEMVAKSIYKNLKNRLYVGKVNGDTLISDIMGKIIIVIDKKISLDYDKYPNCSTPSFFKDDGEKSTENPESKCFNLSVFTNLESNGDNLRTYKYGDMLDQNTNPPHIKDNNTTDITVLKMVYPDVKQNTSNPEVVVFIKKYGIQFVAVRLYMVDANLKLYEKTFSDGGMAVCPISKIGEKPTTIIPI
jgi:hypothetical protein